MAYVPYVAGRSGAIATATPNPASTPTPTPWPTLHAFVEHVVDGDTIDVRYHDVTLRVRYIGVDTPERGECHAEEATSRNVELVGGRWVDLVRDVDERDGYNRHLFYVYADDQFVNELLVGEGLALCLPIPDNLAHAHSLVQAEERARQNQQGLWSQCVAVKPTPPFDAPTDPQNGVRITYIRYLGSLEYVRLTNVTTQTIDLSGWTLVSEIGSQSVLFGEGDLIHASRDLVVVSGPEAETKSYRGQVYQRLWTIGYIWRNDGDCAKLYAPDGTPVDAWPYGDYGVQAP